MLSFLFPFQKSKKQEFFKGFSACISYKTQIRIVKGTRSFSNFTRALFCWWTELYHNPLWNGKKKYRKIKRIIHRAHSHLLFHNLFTFSEKMRLFKLIRIKRKEKWVFKGIWREEKNSWSSTNPIWYRYPKDQYHRLFERIFEHQRNETVFSQLEPATSSIWLQNLQTTRRLITYSSTENAVNQSTIISETSGQSSFSRLQSKSCGKGLPNYQQHNIQIKLSLS